MRATRAFSLAIITAAVFSGCQSSGSPTGPTSNAAGLSARYEGLGWEGSGHRTTPDSTRIGNETPSSNGEALAVPAGLGWSGSGH